MTFWMLNNTPNVNFSRKFAKNWQKHFTSWNNIRIFKRIFAKSDFDKQILIDLLLNIIIN